MKKLLCIIAAAMALIVASSTAIAEPKKRSLSDMMRLKARCKAHRLARELTAECPKKIAHTMNDPCGAKCPQLLKVL
jgi:hypothetical protein